MDAESIGYLLRQVSKPDLVSAAKLGLMCGAVAAAVSLVVPPRFSSSAAFTSTTTRDLPVGALSAARDLADAFGVAGGSGATAPEFFQAVAAMRSVRERILLARYPVQSGDSTTLRSLLDIYDIGAKSPARQMEKSVQRVGEDIRVSFDRITGLVTVRAEAFEPLLAAAIVDTTIAYLNAANIANRQTQAREERLFLEDRLRSAQDSLSRLERAMIEFNAKNRAYSASPELVIQEAALRRRLDFATQVYSQLAGEAERARMQEVRSTPVLNVLDPAVPAAERFWPRRTLVTLFGLIVGFGLALAYRILRIRQGVLSTPGK